MQKIYFKLVSAFGLAATLAGCVTINIYFPAAAAEKAADKIIEEVWQLKPGEKGAPLPQSPSAAPVPK